MSNSLQPHRQQPTRLLHPWDSPGKSTGVGYHFLLQCMNVKSESEVAQSCLTPSNPMVCSLPGSSVHVIFQTRVLKWVAIAFSIFFYTYIWKYMGFPSGSVVKNSPARAGHGKRYGFNPWVGKIPWRSKWQPTPVFLPGEFHGQRSLVGYSPSCFDFNVE